MSEEKIYCGSAKIVPTQYGELTKVSFHKEDVNKLIQYMGDNSTEWINLVIKAKKDPKPDKPTHYLEVDTWKPSNDAKQVYTPSDNSNTAMNLPNDDLPF